VWRQMVCEWPVAAPRAGRGMDEQTAALLVLQRQTKRKGGLEFPAPRDNPDPDAFPPRATSWSGRRISVRLTNCGDAQKGSGSRAPRSVLERNTSCVLCLQAGIESPIPDAVARDLIDVDFLLTESVLTSRAPLLLTLRSQQGLQAIAHLGAALIFLLRIRHGAEKWIAPRWLPKRSASF